MRRFFKMLPRVMFCAFVAFATVVIGVAFHQNFSWERFTIETLPRWQAEWAAFATGIIDALRSGDPGQMAAALTDGRVLLIAFVLALALVAAIDRLRGPVRDEPGPAE
jgi:hypothetical protein